MSPRENVLNAIAHKEPAKVPFDIGSNPSSGISAIAYSNLLKHLNKEHLPVQVYDVVQQLAQPHDEIVDLLGIDILDIGRCFNYQDEYWRPYRLLNGDQAFYPKWFQPVKNENGDWVAHTNAGEAIAKMPKEATFFDQTLYPWVDGYPSDMKSLDEAMSKVLWAAFTHSPWDQADGPDFWNSLREKTLQLRKSTDKALMIIVGCNLFEWGTFIRRMDNFMMDLYIEPTNVEQLLDALLEKHMATLAKVCEYLGDIVEVIRFGDDLGGMGGPLIDPELYRQFFKPGHKQLCEFVKQNSNMHTFLHSCGSIYQLIPDLIEAGFEILNPVQTQGTDMEPEKLKTEFGKDVTFWGGGIETVGTLNNGTIKEVKAEVFKRLEIFSKNGGFIFNPIHNILPDVPPQNIMAMVDAVKEFNK